MPSPATNYLLSAGAARGRHLEDPRRHHRLLPDQQSQIGRRLEEQLGSSCLLNVVRPLLISLSFAQLKTHYTCPSHARSPARKTIKNDLGTLKGYNYVIFNH